jgi:hypothetical protein
MKTIRQKAKAYDEAVRKAKIALDCCDSASIASKNTVYDIFPELKESEGENIRKELINFLQLPHSQFVGERKQEKWIAWFEKQDGQKLQGKTALETINEEKIDNANYVKSADKVKPKFHKGDWVVVSTTKGDRVVQIASVEYFKDGHPSYFTTEGRWFDNRTKARLLTNKDVEITTIPENRAIVNKIKSWSKEDEDYYDAIIAKLEVTQDDAALTDNQMEFLKSLKERYTWKPSDDQMRALHDMNLTGNISYAGQGQTLIELYNDLKKL